MYRIRNDLCVSDGDREILSIEIINKESKNYIISCCYKPPTGDTKMFAAHLHKNFQSGNSEKKNYFLLGDFNLNCLNYHSNSEVKEFYDDVFQYGAIPLINRPTRVTTSSATLIDNILTNTFFDNSLKKGIIKSPISDHFPIFAAINISKNKNKNKKIEIKKKRF